MSKPIYTVLEELSSTARTSIWKVTREGESRAFAFKHLKNAHPNPYELARLRYEFGLLEELELPFVIRPLAFERIEGHFGILMEIFGDSNLDHFIKINKQPDIGLCLTLAIQIVEALQGIHQSNIIHRDINPRNILIDSQSLEVCVIDFSIALERSQGSQSHEKTLEGSLPYISPEQTGRMNREIDYRSDFYSFAVTFYELLTGQLPFSAPDMLGYIHAHIAKKPEAPSKLRPDCPPMLDQIVLKLLEKNAEDRYQSTFGLLADLKLCRDMWMQNGQIETFTIAQNDRFEAFSFPNQLFGREKERQMLLDSFERASRGEYVNVMIGGYSGVGKSVLVHELDRPVAAQRGFFIHGKYDQYQRQVSLSGVSQALGRLVQQTLLRPEKDIQLIQRNLLKSLVGLVPTLQKLVPEVCALLPGESAEPEVLSSAESSKRALRSLIGMLQVYAESGTPVALFLDDLQWADQGSLEFIRELSQLDTGRSLCLIGAYRDHEITPQHPLRLLFDELAPKPSSVRLSLQPLGKEHTNGFIAATLRRSPESVRELTTWVYGQSDGNPFYICEILKDFHQRKLFSYDYHKGSWEFNLASLQTQATADNVVEFLIHRLRELSAECLWHLQVAACIGHTFPLSLLKSLPGPSTHEILAALESAFDRQLIICRSHDVKVLLASHETEQQDNLVFHFRHDRIQQAIYSLISDTDRVKIHLQLARKLQDMPSSLQQHMQLAHHYLACFQEINDAGEQRIMLEAFSDAAKLAKGSNSYENAVQFSGTARQLMPSTYWKSFPDLAFDIEFTYFEANFLVANFAESEQAAQDLLPKVKVLEQQMRVLYLLCFQYAIQMNVDACLDSGRQALALVGIRIPRNPSFPHVFYQFLRVTRLFLQKSDQELIEAREMTDISKKLALKILFEMIAVATNSEQRWLNGVCIFRATEIALRSGISAEGAYAYMLFSIVVGIYFKKRAEGKRIAEVSLAIVERLSTSNLRGRTYGCFANFVHNWFFPTQGLLSYLKRSLEASYEEGDLLWIAAVSITTPVFTLGISLEELATLQQRYNEIVASTGHEEFVTYGLATVGYCMALRGLTKSPLDFSFADFDEETKLKELEIMRSSMTIATIYSNKIENAMSHGLWTEAWAMYQSNKTHFRALMGTGNQFDFVVLTTILMARVAAEKGRWARLKTAVQLLVPMFEARAWMRFNPSNFTYHTHFIIAEQSRLLGLKSRASDRYDRAIDAARALNNFRYEALALQRAFQLHQSGKNKRLAQIYCKEWLQVLTVWGANSRIAFLKKNYPDYCVDEALQPVHEKSTTLQEIQIGASSLQGHSHAQSLDMTSLLKASQALIGEVRLEALLTKLMDCLLENAGADRAVLVLVASKDQFTVSMEASAGSGSSRLLNEPLEDSQKLSLSLVRSVLRSRKEILIDDLKNHPELLQDPYLLKHPALSILCVPMIHQGQLRGLIYLENRLSRGAFTGDRLQMVEILASQTSVSIENARLYENLELRVVERTRDIRSILENIRQGIFTVSSLELKADAEYSQFLETILDTKRIAGNSLRQVLLAQSNLSSDQIHQVEASLSATLGDSRLAFELNSGHLPRELRKTLDGSSSILEIDWYPITDDQDTVQKILISVRDVTALRSLQEEAKQRDGEMERIAEIAESPAGKLLNFLDEAEQSIRSVEQALEYLTESSTPIRLLDRCLHTLKGLARSLNLKRLASELHEAEEGVKVSKATHDDCSLWIPPLLSELRFSLNSYKATFSRLKSITDLRKDHGSILHLMVPSLEALGQLDLPAEASQHMLALQAIIAEQKPNSWLDLKYDLQLVISEVAKTLHKPVPNLVMNIPTGLVLGPLGNKLLKEVFVHLLRNSLDHGIELESERLRSGKSRCGSIRIQILQQAEECRIRFSDDGRGLDFAKIKQKAEAVDILPSGPALDHSQLAELLFHAGFSTSRSVTEISGRGIGLDAVRHALDEQGGSIAIELTSTIAAEVSAFVFSIRIPLAILSESLGRGPSSLRNAM